MSEEKQIEQEIGWLKIVFAILSAIDVSLIAWVAQNYTIISSKLTVVVIVLVLIITLVIVLVNKIAYNKIDKIGEL